MSQEIRTRFGTQGKNSFVVEFTSATTKEPVDAGKVTLNTSMSMPGMAPMVADATLSPDKVPVATSARSASRTAVRGR